MDCAENDTLYVQILRGGHSRSWFSHMIPRAFMIIWYWGAVFTYAWLSEIWQQAFTVLVLFILDR